MGNKTPQILNGQKEKHASFWLASQELMASEFQKEIDRMKREITGLKIENYGLKIACGELREDICSRCLTREDCSSFKSSMISWGDIASFLSSKQMEFYHELFTFSVQSWIQPALSGTQMMLSPVQAFRKRVVEVLLDPQSRAFRESDIECLADFVASIICFREYNTDHEDILAIEEVFLDILKCVARKDGIHHSGAESLLPVFMDNDASRCIITRTVCKLCSELSHALCEEVIAADNSISQNKCDLSSLDFMKLCSLCQLCVSKLSQWSQSNHSKDKMLEGITEYIWKISRDCDILSALSPAMAFEGKRLYCKLIATLQVMGTYN